MRLTERQYQAIQRAITRRDPEAETYLYGSRADDSARGGDIDLLVISRQLTLMDKLDILGELHRSLGERRIDLLIAPDTARPIAAIAKENGVRL